MSNETIKIFKCRVCKFDHALVVSDKQMRDWREGGHAQDVMSHLTADQRELIISGTCGTCFDAIFEA